MKKFVSMVLAVLMCFSAAGCGGSNKKIAELTDIEQFKCQGNIQDVFDVLGKTEMETSTFGAEYYTYDNLNLWGYDGEVIFNVRSDKETIQDFRCHLNVNEEEIEEIYSYFSKKYGTYEVSEVAGNKLCKWNIDEEGADNLGYNNIIVEYGDTNNCEIAFFDEWSIMTDEAYYEYLDNETEKDDIGESFTLTDEQLNNIEKSSYEKGKELSEDLTEKLENIDWEENYQKAEDAGRKLAELLNGKN